MDGMHYCLLFNLWMLCAGILFLFSIPVIYCTYISVSRPITITLVVFILVFAIGACIFTCFFSVNETKNIVTTASKIHGVGSAIGFMLVVFVPLLLSTLSFRMHHRITGALFMVSFVLTLLFFILFVMSDKPSFEKTWIAQEGLWQRLNLLFMYLPLGYIAAANIFDWIIR